MTRLSPPSPAGKEWLTTPTIVKYTSPFWVSTGSCEPTVQPVAAASPAGSRKLGPSSSAGERGRPVSGDDIEAAERVRRPPGRSRRRPPRRRRRSPTGSEAAWPGRRPELLLIADGHLVVLGHRAGHEHVSGKEMGDPAVTRGQRSGTQRAHTDSGRHRDGQARGGHGRPVPGPREVSRAGLRAADEGARSPGRSGG